MIKSGGQRRINIAVPVAGIIAAARFFSVFTQSLLIIRSPKAICFSSDSGQWKYILVCNADVCYGYNL
jgi:hypothetical protein